MEADFSAAPVLPWLTKDYLRSCYPECFRLTQYDIISAVPCSVCRAKLNDECMRIRKGTIPRSAHNLRRLRAYDEEAYQIEVRRYTIR